VTEDKPFDLRSRIGTRAAAAPATPVDRIDGPLPPRLDGPLQARRDDRPVMIGFAEPAPQPIRPTAPLASFDAAADDEEPKTSAIPSPRGAPGPGEIDLVVTPLPTPDDWHRFELALRRVRGVGQLRTEYYRHGVLKVRVAYAAQERLSSALRASVPGYRVRVIGEDRTTLQILVQTEADERRPS